MKIEITLPEKSVIQVSLQFAKAFVKVYGNLRKSEKTINDILNKLEKAK